MAEEREDEEEEAAAATTPATPAATAAAVVEEERRMILNREYALQAMRLEELRQRRLQASFLPATGNISQYGYQDGTNGDTAAGDPLIYPGLYAPSGFNIMDILVKIYTRPNPQIPLGSIDQSVALTLCDLSVPNTPIVYCSDPFLSLTGYPRDEVVGRNCRFLQHPSLATGLRISARDFKVNEVARRELRDAMQTGAEARVQLVNFTRDGTRFENVLTIVPIIWEGDRQYVVGFQADARRIFAR